MSKQPANAPVEKADKSKSEKKVKKVLKKIKNDLEKLRKKRDKQNLKLNNLNSISGSDDKAKELKSRLAKIEKKTKKKLKKLRSLKKKEVVVKKPTPPKMIEVKAIPVEVKEKAVRKSTAKTSADLSFKEAIETIKKMATEKKIDDFVAVEKRSTVMNAAKSRIKAVRKASAKEKKVAAKKST